MTSQRDIQLKVCGMRDPENILGVAARRPDYMGFIFYRGSKRAVGENFQIPNGFPPEIKKVGVFVNESTDAILDLVKKHALDFVQLHGAELPLQCEELKKAGVGVINVFAMDDSFDFRSIGPYKKVCDYFLFDTRGTEYGGSGIAFDWNLLKRYDQEIPFFLSGGLSLENIPDVSHLQGMNLYGLDVNSGVEVKPGLKDLEKLENLQNRIHHLRYTKHEL